MAKAKVEQIQKKEVRKKEKLEVLLRHLEDEISRVEYLIEEEDHM
jgi:hypothetical protein